MMRKPQQLKPEIAPTTKLIQDQDGGEGPPSTTGRWNAQLPFCNVRRCMQWLDGPGVMWSQKKVVKKNL